MSITISGAPQSKSVLPQRTTSPSSNPKAGSSARARSASVAVHVVARCMLTSVPVPKVIYTTDGAKRGFITAMLAPVNCKQEPRFGVRQTMLFVTLTFGMVALARLLLAQ